ncbi:rhomboid family intramembrane serine protease [Tumebacillus permanentifrigoris]|uniref:Membrane associated rhomboid family serine protease n=1 Tax=Tumebacillus permanentifrigoris TaxID=378543 RepID=A0A316DCW5_9BACL|nr:rhomboid family intramembrane serine protease [Tumebacillus permanentifrigoris]PWK14353.1 membrane associated rhomboid family serine protease [Tumebacillus permanentifrigoris]
MSEQQQFSTFLYGMAQYLIAHDDFTILPQDASEGQGTPQVLLARQQFQSLQYVRLLPADGLTVERIQAIMEHDAKSFGERQRSQNVYSVTFFIFSQWRSDENMREIARTTQYLGYLKSIGAAAVAVDLSRGVLGEWPDGKAVRGITVEPLRELIANYPNRKYPDELLWRTSEQWEDQLVELSERRQERILSPLNEGKKTIFTIGILALTVLIFLIGRLDTSEQFLYNGLMVPELIRNGELFRLLTPVFFHYDVSHIFFNMWSLWVLGRYVERIYGGTRFLIVYVLAGVAGCMLSFAFNDNPSLGASGAIFGLMGALLAFGRTDRKAFSMSIGSSVYYLLALNLVIGFIIPRIDYWGHLGGLAGGFLIGMVVGMPGYEAKQRWLYGAGYLAFAALTLLIGWNA